ncbi:hypothetical protein [Acinetobacter haemolyticus]|uniref:hypothetical protein n=1 Tax=Acinetobacter haemolyticus TaxID=29430 RepID=UPI001372A1BE|nr:hypothetical protein [Acinetobacter haemolyticus]NAS00716.1 hypothetical protein [Acinetobacter haemolyticus]
MLENIKSKAFDFSENLSLLELKLDEKLVNLSLELIFDFVPLEESFKALIDSYIQVLDICNKNDQFSKNIGREQDKLKSEVLEERIVEYLIEFEWHKKNSKIIDLEESVGKLIPFEQENSERVSEIQTYQVNIQEEIKKLNSQKSTISAA